MIHRENTTGFEGNANLRVDIGDDAYEMGFVHKEADPMINEVIGLLDKGEQLRAYMVEHRQGKHDQYTAAIEAYTERRSKEWDLDSVYIEEADELHRENLGFAARKELNDRKIGEKKAEIEALQGQIDETDAALTDIEDQITETEASRNRAHNESAAAQTALALFKAESLHIQHQYEEQIQDADEMTLREQYDTYGGGPRQHHGLNNLSEEKRRQYDALEARKRECQSEYAALEMQFRDLIKSQVKGVSFKEDLLEKLEKALHELRDLEQVDAGLQTELISLNLQHEQLQKKFNIGFVAEAQQAAPSGSTAEHPSEPNLRIDVDDEDDDEIVGGEEAESSWVPQGRPVHPRAEQVASSMGRRGLFGLGKKK